MLLHLLECPKPLTLTIANDGEDVEPWELLFIAGGIRNGTATPEGSLAFLAKLIILLPYNSAMVLLAIY